MRSRGAPLRPPKSLAGRTYKLFMDLMRFGCVLVCTSRLIYARGPTYSERHSCLVFVLMHLYLLATPWCVFRALFTDTFRHMLRSMEGASGEQEFAKRAQFELKTFSTVLVVFIPFMIALAYFAYLPLFFDGFHTGPSASMLDAAFGIFSGVWFAIGIPTIVLQWLASMLTHLFLEVIMSLDTLHQRLFSWRRSISTSRGPQFSLDVC